MKSFRVILNENSNPQDIQKLIGAVEQMKSVKKIDSLNLDKSDFVGQAEQGMPHSGQQQSPQGYSQKSTPNPAGGATPQMPISEDSQRRFISSSIKWGVKNGKISIDKIKVMTPEETIHIAMKLAELMPDEEKQRLADEIQNA